MNSRLRPLLAAAALASALCAPAAFADLLVSGTPGAATIAPGATVSAKVSVTDPNPDLDLANLATWDFRLEWGSAPLVLDTGASSMKLLGGVNAGDYSLAALFTLLDPTEVSTLAGSSYGFRWIDNDMSIFDLSGGFEFTAVFGLASGAAAGAYDITFGTSTFPSSLADWTNLVESTYIEVSTAEPRMLVTLRDAQPGPAPAPEPGMLALLLGGLGVLVAARRRR